MGLISILIISGLFWSFEIVSGGIRFIAFSNWLWFFYTDLSRMLSSAPASSMGKLICG